MRNLERPIPVQFYVTADEKALIEKKMAALGTQNLSAYLRKMALDGYILRLDLPELKEMVTQMKRIGNNVNQMLREAIDAALVQKPATFGDLLALLEKEGYAIKRGKQPSFRKEGQKRFVRLDTLGEEYSKEVLSAVIAGKQTHKPKRRRIAAQEEKTVSLLVDVEAKLQAGKGAGYAHDRLRAV